MAWARVVLVAGWLCMLLAVASLLLAAGGSLFHTYMTDSGSGIAIRPEPVDFAGMRGELGSLPSFTPTSGLSNVDLRSYDLSKLDVTDRLLDLQRADFDTETVWPAQLPESFAPDSILETAKDPGLGLRALHAQGITGRGVSIGIIDQALLVDHVEYAGRVRLYEEIHDVDRNASMHGPALASIAVGSTVGVAPEADLYYIADWFVSDTWADEQPGAMPTIDYTWLAKSLDRLLEVNRALPDDRKIRAIAIARGWNPSETGYQELTDAVQRAADQGVFVVSCSVDRTHGFTFHGLGRDPAADPDDSTSYDDSSWDKYYLDDHPGAPAPILVPMDARTVASFTGTHDYAFYRGGGWSWAVPYIAGLYALACQVQPDITPKLFWSKAVETGDTRDLPAKAAPLSQQELEQLDQRVAQMVDAIVDRIKSQAGDTDLETAFGAAYTKQTGDQKDTMSEAEFRAWASDLVRSRELPDTRAHKLGRIVDPPRLIASLRSPS